MIFLRRIFAIPLVLVVAFFVFIFGFHIAKAAVVFDNTAVPLPQNIDFNNRILSLPTNFRINLPDTKSHIGSVRLWVAHETAQYFANLYCNGILPGCDESQWNSGFGFGLINLQIGWNGTFCIARPNNGNPSAIFFKDSPDHTWTEVTLILNDNYNSGSPEMKECAIPTDDSGNNFINTLSFGVGYGWTMATTPEGMPIMQVFDADEQKVPVLIIPGIAGTKLFEGEDELWPDLSKMFWNLGDDFLVDKLGMDENGVSKNSIAAKEVLENIQISFINKHYFDDLLYDLETMGLEKDNNLFLYPYDWRKDLNVTGDLLNTKIEEIKQKTGSSKVDVIAHSMGGLLTKTYIKKYGSESINKLIFVGTPHLGAPQAFKVLKEGEDFSIPWLRDSAIQKIAKNMSSIYQLLPQEEYIQKNGYYLRVMRKGEGMKDLSYTEGQDLLKEMGYNSNLITNADAWSKDVNSVKYGNVMVYNFAGCKTWTDNTFSMRRTDVPVNYVGRVTGDGTVPLNSADAIEIPLTNKFYFKNADHGEMPSAEKVRKAIVTILKGVPVITDTELSNSTESCWLKGRVLSFFSPVEVHVYNKIGEHVGPVNDAIEYGIKGVGYKIIDGHKFIFLPTDEGQEYNIQGRGLDVGTFDLRVEQNENGHITEAQIFNDVKITPQSKINFIVNGSTQNTEIQMDYEGTGSYLPVIASAVLSGGVSQDFFPPITISSSTPSDINSWNKTDVVVDLIAKDEESGILETKFSIDGGEFALYSKPYVITKEGETFLRYYSIDKAGNNEETKELKIKIDKTSPEFSVYFSSEDKDLVFLGEDNFSKAEEIKITENDDNILLEDLAGNTTELKLKEKNRKKSFSGELTSLAYNGKEVDIAKNRFSFAWAYDKKGVLKSLAQHIASKKDFALFSLYDGKNTKLLSWVKGVLPDIKIYKGLKIIKINSNQGKLLWKVI